MGFAGGALSETTQELVGTKRPWKVSTRHLRLISEGLTPPKIASVFCLKGPFLSYSQAMARLTFPTSPRSAWRGCGHLLVIGRGDQLERGVSTLPDGAEDIASQLAAEAKFGRGGAVATSLVPGGAVARVTVGLLPASSSRYNARGRPDVVARAVSGARLTRGDRATVVLCVEDREDLPAMLTGLARGLPLFDRTSQSRSAEAKINVLALGPDEELLKIESSERTRIGAVRDAARLVDTPPTELNPEAFAKEARRILEPLKRVSLKEISGPALARKRVGGHPRRRQGGRLGSTPPGCNVQTGPASRSSCGPGR